ncbi:MAG: CoA-transferase [Chloroflexota bacterium]
MMVQRIDLQTAADLITDNSMIALGGMALYRRPVAFVRALLRRSPPQNLTLLAFTAGYAADLMIGTGCVTTIRTVYAGLEVFGFAPMFTVRASSGELRVQEETETSIVLGLRAAAAGVGYLPSLAWQGTDLLDLRLDVHSITDPYTAEPLTAFPAINPDVAVIHALAVDANGNAAINNNLAIDQLLVYASRTVIVTTESFVDVLRPSGDHTIIPSTGINFICHAAGGARPTSCFPLYKLEGSVLAGYVEDCSRDAGFDEHLAAFIGASPDQP